MLARRLLSDSRISHRFPGRQAFARFALLLVLAWSLLPGARPLPASAASGTTYVVQSGDTLGLIALTYGTTVDAIMQANGLASPDMIYAGQTLAIPTPAAMPAPAASGASAGAPAETPPSSSLYTVTLGDTLASIAGRLGVSPAALAETNSITDPDLLYVGQQLRIPGATLGSAASAPPPSDPANQAAGVYVVRPGDTLNAIAASLGVTPGALADVNGLSDADLLVVGQKLVAPGATSAANAPTTQVLQPTAEPVASGTKPAGRGPYVVQPGDTLAAIAAKLGVDLDALARVNGLTDADLLSIGQELVLPDASPAGQQAPAETAQPAAQPLQPTAPPTSGNAPAEYVVRPGDTLNSIALGLGVDPDALAQANGLANANVLSVGQKLVVPGASPAASGTGDSSQQPPSAAPVPPLNAQAPGQIQYKVKPGDTLGSIALKYKTTAAQIARTNQLSSPDLVSVGMTLIIPDPGWTANFSGPPSRFVVSIKLQRCWLYQGNEIVANWPCSTGQAGTDTHPGSYKIQSKMDRAFGSTWNIWMPYWLGIYWAGASENGIHGIPYSATDNNWRLWEGYVGTPVTYGCVLLDNVHMKELYDVAYIGMPVIIQP